MLVQEMWVPWADHLFDDPSKLTIWRPFTPISFKNFLAYNGPVKLFWGRVPKLRVIFGEILLCVEA